MEIYKPVKITPGMEEVTPKIVDINSWDIKIDKKEFKFQLDKSEDKKVIFKLINCEEFPPINYILHVSEEEFKKMCPIFKFEIYKKIDDIYSLLYDTINDKQYSFKQNDKKITLTFHFYLLLGKKFDLSFDLNEQERKYSFEEVYLLLHKLSEENKTIKEEFTNQNKEMKKRINILEEEIDKKNKEIIDIKKEFKELKDEFHQKIIIDNCFNDSKIIKIKEEKNKLISWISEKGIIKEINLLYSSKKDRDGCSSFYTKCSNISPTLSLIKTKKGRKFGGFTFGKWNDKQKIPNQTDSEAFLFSLNNMKKYKILKPNLAMASYSDHSSFLTYGNNGDGCGIYLKNNFLTNGGHENHSSNVYNVDSKYCLSKEENFNVEEVEVYNIIFY